jgi:serine/threonine protein kinase/tetratricopeptide (TPR) repeat protein
MLGQTISHYTIIEKLGGGGMGVVYKAEDTKLKRQVALKFLPPELTRDPDAKERFMHEAQAASSLQHTNICTIHDIDETEDGQMFISMDCYSGETLKKKIEHGPLKIAEAVELTTQIAQGLSKAHANGIVHRDLKPANIMVTEDGVAKILDFGLAKLAGQTKLTKEGVTAGTAAYMSPEQARGETVDHRTDIWSLGVVLYEMLSGQPPFKGEYDLAVIYSIMNESPQKLDGLRSDIPKRLVRIVESCLSKDKLARPQSMREVLQMLGMERKPILLSLAVWRHWSRPLRISFACLSLLIIVMVVWLFRPKVTSVAPSGQSEWRIGLLPFADLTKQEEASDWPMLVQAMMVDHLTGMEEVRVVDPFSLNGLVKSSFADFASASKANLYQTVRQADVSLLVEGTVSRTDTGYVIQCTMVDPLRSEVKLSHLDYFARDRDLPRVVENISNEILSYFNIKILVSDREQDLRPWFKNRTKNLAAVKAFLQACEFKYNMRKGGNNYLREAIKLDSTFIAPRIWLLATLTESGKDQEAEEQYRVLLRLEQNASPLERALIRWSGACLNQDLQAQAQALETALDFSPKNNVLLYLLGRIRYLLGDFKGAAEAIQPAVDMKWRFQPAYYMLGASYSSIKMFREAKAVLEQSLLLEPVYPPTYSVLAALSLLEQDTVKSQQYAKTYFEKETASGKSRDSIYAALGSVLLSHGLYGGSAGYLSRAIDLNPRDPQYHYVIGRAFQGSGLVDSAQAHFYRAVELDPALVDVHIDLGEVYVQKGDTARAIRHYRTYLKNDSTSAQAKEIQQRVSMLER